MRISARLPGKAVLNLIDSMWRQQCILVVCAVYVCCLRSEREYRKNSNSAGQQDKDDLSLWIDQQQVKMYSGK